MRRTTMVAVVGVLGATLMAGAGGCSTPVTKPDAHPSGVAVTTAVVAPNKETIADLFKQWNAALATGDPQKVADRYAPDAVLLPTVSNKVRTNRAEIVDYFIHFLENKPQGTIKQSVINVLDGTTAIDTGVYVFTLTGGGKQRTVEARYTFVYELRNGKWLIVNHHSSAMPESTAQQP